MEPPLTLRRGGLVALAALVLLPGAAVYLGERSLAIAAWLPSLVHPMAFSLLAAASLPCQARWHHAACGTWCAINLLFEAGQHPALARPVVEVLGDGRLGSYFLHGSFDPADVAAIVAGSACAAACLAAWRGRARAS